MRRDSNDTYPPQLGSPAIDRGSSATPGSGGEACGPNDQRGAARPQDGNSNGIATCDIGAYEVVPPDLAISFMSDLPDPVQAGGNLIYTIDVVNPGPTTLSNVRMIDTLPAGVIYNSYAETRGGSCGPTVGHTITCNLSSLDGNRVWTIYLYTTVDPATVGTRTASVPIPAGDDATAFRIHITTPTAGTPARATRVFHVQFEDGPYPTSRIVTAGAEVTREPDQLLVSNNHEHRTWPGSTSTTTASSCRSGTCRPAGDEARVSWPWPMTRRRTTI